MESLETIFSIEIKQILGSQDIRFRKQLWIFDDIVYVRFRCKMDDIGGLMLLENVLKSRYVSDIHFFENIIGS